ncbi:hypothetical protein [Polycladomyces subterraneus]|uniref:Uncharacterized protein n=1 Tax=Polycladomyces subterraneus TaxID=1016997 RepID=A0ABT8IJU1_9BACL|nr:hypothetical protein [Polycladomyces subterraneus]MDN4593052.1 hypothetical protein [Polycladomyces subterraneus]
MKDRYIKLEEYIEKLGKIIEITRIELEEIRHEIERNKMNKKIDEARAESKADGDL